jgi:23S rRNA pseudouridine2604 synthase
VGEDDTVLVDGQSLRARRGAPGKRRHVYIALNKPSASPARPSARQGQHHRLHRPPGADLPDRRLDKDSEGLILLTSNGDIVNEILRAENKLEKEYLVAINHPVTDEFLRGMARGVPLHGETTLPCKTGKLGRFGFRIVLVQGLNRQIR